MTSLELSGLFMGNLAQSVYQKWVRLTRGLKRTADAARLGPEPLCVRQVGVVGRPAGLVLL